MNPLLKCDTYKTCHENMMPKGLTRMDSYLTPRKSMIESQDKVVVFGITAWLKDLKEDFDTNFFSKALPELLDDYHRYMNLQLGQDVYDDSRIERLYELGYLPLAVEALPEGSLVNMGVPIAHIYNTHPDFAWLGQWAECWMLNSVWKTCNFATIGHMYYKLAKKYYDKTTDGQDPRMAASDFGMRGMSCMEEAQKCSASWLLSFNKTSTVPALYWADKYYEADCSFNHLGIGAVSTEHSVMASNFAVDGDERTFFKRMLTELYPDTSFSIVSDTYDYWNVVNNIMPSLKEEILAHNGKILLRPDSGDQYENVIKTIQILWETFGGTENKKGYKLLNPHVGIILGDGCTLKQVEKIWKKLDEMKFAASNVAFGVGAFCFSAIFDKDKMIVNTRDTWGFACKATAGLVNNKYIPIFKDPKTDTENLKKSHKGLCVVNKTDTGYIVEDQIDYNHYDTYKNDMVLLFKDGKFYNKQTFTKIRDRLAKESV